MIKITLVKVKKLHKIKGYRTLKNIILKIKIRNRDICLNFQLDFKKHL